MTNSTVAVPNHAQAIIACIYKSFSRSKSR